MTATPIRYLVLWLTTACNLRCVYCYRGEPEARSMPVGVAEKAVELAAASGLPFHVQLAGGEPTLERKLIGAVGEMVRKPGHPATMALQTNGTLIDAELAALCRHYEISIGLSIDGPPAVHEKVRGKAGATFRGLELLAREKIPVRVTTVLSAANVERLAELALSLAAFPNVEGIGLDPVVYKGKANLEMTPAPSGGSLRYGIRNLLSMLKRINELRAAPIRWRELDAVRRALSSGAVPKAYCHACMGESLAVHPDGSVYPCGQSVGDPAMRAGSVECVDLPKLRGIYRDLRLRGDCGGCPLEERCPGDCPSRLAYNHGASSKTMCLIYRTIAEDAAMEEIL
jgi:uncharacterized protein